jgi:hypothetical protein
VVAASRAKAGPGDEGIDVGIGRLLRGLSMLEKRKIEAELLE